MDNIKECSEVNTSSAGLLRASLDSQQATWPPMPVVLTRSRAKELMDLAHETVLWLEGRGLQRGEQCFFTEVATRLWFLS